MDQSYKQQKIKNLLNNIKSNKQLLSVLIDFPAYIPLIEERITSKMQLKIIKSNYYNLNYFKDIDYKNQFFIYANNFQNLRLIKKIHPKILSRIYKKIYKHPDNIVSSVILFNNIVIPENLLLISIRKSPNLICYVNEPNKQLQNTAIENLNTSQSQKTFIHLYLDKIQNPMILLKLYNKTQSTSLKNIIIKSPFWKDDANLILEVINE